MNGALQNFPLFIKTTQEDNELQYHYAVHTSLDVIEEKISSVGKNTNDLRELYLGLLYSTEEYKVYPFIDHSTDLRVIDYLYILLKSMQLSISLVDTDTRLIIYLQMMSHIIAGEILFNLRQF